MTKREKLLEQYEDALFSLLMDEFARTPRIGYARSHAHRWNHAHDSYGAERIAAALQKNDIALFCKEKH